MATWSDQLFQTLEGEQAIEGRYSDKAKERTFHHGPNCHRQFAWRPNICPQSVLIHTVGTPLAAGMGPYMLPLKLRPPSRHGPERTEEVDMASESTEPIERWTAKRRVALVVSILKGETSVAEAARTHGLTVAEVEEWREKFLLGAENALRSRPRDEEAVKEEQIKKLKQKIGDLVLDNDILREALTPYPLDRKTSDA